MKNSHEESENQKVVASHLGRENQKAPASQDGEESHITLASQSDKEKPSIISEPYASAKLGHKHISNWKEAVSKNIQMRNIKLEEKNKK